ncbi:MAG: diacylglycerol kinase [Candidatus Kaiserbacteria bacterium]|nr:diacylglycerol kinase [Candidatus Kaiserbacteria bacterium]MCB9815863.1 diacylglycerol kinase [Candidatus Nomurabacteria bacterium]
MIKKYFRRFPHALRGLTYALRHDFGFASQVALAAIVALLAYYFFKPFSTIEALFLTLSTFLIFITELQNSALEAALDRIHPELHDGIKHSKDMAAGAVFLAGIFFAIVLITIGVDRLA